MIKEKRDKIKLSDIIPISKKVTPNNIGDINIMKLILLLIFLILLGLIIHLVNIDSLVLESCHLFE